MTFIIHYISSQSHKFFISIALISSSFLLLQYASRRSSSSLLILTYWLENDLLMFIRMNSSNMLSILSYILQNHVCIKSLSLSQVESKLLVKVHMFCYGFNMLFIWAVLINNEMVCAILHYSTKTLSMSRNLFSKLL